MKIEILYPDLCDLYGDPANLKYILPAIQDAKVYRTCIFEEPKFVSEDVDFIYIGSMSEESQKMVCEKLMPLKERIRELIDLGVIILATGNALEVFGDKIVYEDGSETSCLGFFHGTARPEMMNRHNSLFLGELNFDEEVVSAIGEKGTKEGAGSEDNENSKIEIVGFKSQFGHILPTDEGDTWMPLFKKVRGVGIDGKKQNSDMGEGVRINNFMATYLLGPLLILNPPFTKYLLSLLGGNCKLPYENVAMEVYETRLSEFKDPNRGFFY